MCVICLYRDYSLRLRYTRGLLIGLFTGFLIYCVRNRNIIYLFDNFTIQFYLFRIHFDNMDFVASLILVFILKYSLFYNYGIFLNTNLSVSISTYFTFWGSVHVCYRQIVSLHVIKTSASSNQSEADGVILFRINQTTEQNLLLNAT